MCRQSGDGVLERGENPAMQLTNRYPYNVGFSLLGLWKAAVGGCKPEADGFKEH